LERNNRARTHTSTQNGVTLQVFKDAAVVQHLGAAID